VTRPFDERVDELFLRVIELPIEDRAAFLIEHRDAPEVVRAVEALLEHVQTEDKVRGQLMAHVGEAIGSVETAPEADLVGTILRDPDSGAERWEIVQRLPSSSRAEVYVVIDRSTDVPCVMKTYPERAMIDEPELREALVVEAIIWQAIPLHPFVANVRNVESINGRLLINVEYFSQGDLSVRLRSGPIDVPLALWYGVQICDAMRHAYAHGLRAHRDLKPANCLVHGSNLVAVTDFGIGLPAVTEGRDQLIGGTPAYMPPEQWASVQCDERSDLYSFAATLYDMLAGHPPFGQTLDATVEELRQSHEALPVVPIPGLAEPINTLLTECMAKDPSDRPRSFASVREVLAGILRDVYDTSVPPKPVQPPHDPISHLMQQANSLDAMGRLDQAMALYDELLTREVEPHQRVELLVNRGGALRKLGRLQEARRDGERSVELEEDIAVAWLNLGNTYDDLDRHDDAETCFERAESLDPRIRARVAYERAVTLDRAGRSTEAKAAYRHALDLNPDNAMALCNLGQLLRERGDRENAMQHFDRALDKNKNLEEAHFNKGRMLYEAEQFAEALECFRQALRVAPDDELNRRWFEKAKARLDALGQSTQGEDG